MFSVKYPQKSASSNSGGGYIHPSIESTNTNSDESKLPSILGNSVISLSSSDSDDDDDDNDNNDDDDDGDDDGLNFTIAAALAAAAWTSRGDTDAGRGRNSASSGKLRIAESPLMLNAATSCALAAISGVGNVPSQIRDFLRG